MHHSNEAMPPGLADEMRKQFAGQDMDAIKSKIKEIRLGATGQFPDGKLGPKDEGELAFGMAADSKNALLHVDFGKPVQWFSMTRKQALEVAEAMRVKALSIPDKIEF